MKFSTHLPDFRRAAVAVILCVIGLLSPNLHASLRNGLYVPKSSNNRSVCPQQVRAIHVDGKLSAIEVIYVGDCYYQGPFEYYCLKQDPEGLVCSFNGIEFAIHDERRFRWENRPYDIWAEFELSE